MIKRVTAGIRPENYISKSGKSGRIKKEGRSLRGPALAKYRLTRYLITTSFMTLSNTAPFSPLAVNL